MIRTSRRRCARRDPAVGVSRGQYAPLNIPLEHPPEQSLSVSADGTSRYRRRVSEEYSSGIQVVPRFFALSLALGAVPKFRLAKSILLTGEWELVRAMFRSVGEVYDVPEAQFSAFSALGGASGAFVQMYIDALSSAGVRAHSIRSLKPL